MINIVLFEPEIPENTGNIARTCVGFNAKLHLIRPYGFILNSKKLRRAGVDYWDNLSLCEYDCFDDLIKLNNIDILYVFSRYGTKSPDIINFKENEDIWIMFGKESTGIPKEILDKYSKTLLRIPTSKNIRSLNLSNTVAIALYEVKKQQSFIDLSVFEPHKINIK